MKRVEMDINLPGAIVIEGHVQGLSNVRSLGELEIPVYVVDVRNCLARYSKYCKEFFICPPFDSEEFADFLVRIAERMNIRGWFLMPSNDHIVENLTKHSAKLSKYYRILGPTEKNLYKIINKKHLLETAEQCGVSIPRTCYPETLLAARDFRYPVLIKGNYGLSFYKAVHAKAIVANTYDELSHIIQQYTASECTKEIMIQERIPTSGKNKVVSFTCFAVEGEIKSYWMGIKIREHPIENGTGTMAKGIIDNRLLLEAVPLIRALSYSGICEIEFMYDVRDNSYNLIEINPRTWLWVGLAKASGIDYAKMAYKYACGINQVFPEQYETGIIWVNRLTDFVYGFIAIIKNKLSVREFITSYNGKTVSAVWSSNDVLPGLMFPLMSFSIAKHRR